MRIYIKPQKDGTYILIYKNGEPVEGEVVFTDLTKAYNRVVEIEDGVKNKDVVE